MALEGGNANLYAYTLNSPTNYIDPTGEIVPFIIPAVLACVRGAGASLAADALSGRKPNVGDAVLGCLTGGANKAFSAAKTVGRLASRFENRPSPNVKKILDAIKANKYKVKTNPKNLATKQEGNVTIDVGGGKKLIFVLKHIH